MTPILELFLEARYRQRFYSLLEIKAVQKSKTVVKNYGYFPERSRILITRRSPTTTPMPAQTGLEHKAITLPRSGSSPGYVYVSIYVCVCIYTHVYICVFIGIYMHINTYIHVYTYIYTHLEGPGLATRSTVSQISSKSLASRGAQESNSATHEAVP